MRTSLQHMMSLESNRGAFPGVVHQGSALSCGGALVQGQSMEGMSTTGVQQHSRSLSHTLKLKAASISADPYGRLVNLYSCQWCSALFKTSHGLKGHISKVHGDNPNFRCAVCGQGFVMKSHYEGHMNMHFNVKAFECPNCPRKFAYKSSLKHHMKLCGLKAARQGPRLGDRGEASSADD